MRILAVREATIPIGARMRNASIAFDTMTASALAIVTDRQVAGKPVIGYAFDSIGRYGKGGLLAERFMPRLLAAAPEQLLDASGLIDPVRAWPVMMANEKEGGHGERPGAVGLLDAALWDARAKAEGRPLWRVLADRYGTPAATPAIATYGSCGHYRPGESLADLVAEVRRAADAGYATVKIKVGGASIEEDSRRVAAAREVVTRVAVDVNGRLGDALAEPWLAAMAGARVEWVEEPASPLDYQSLARIAAQSATPLATGENLFSLDDARNLLRYGGLRPDRDRLQFDMLLAYGVPEYARILEFSAAAGWPRAAFWPHAGHLFAAHCVAGLSLGSAEAAPDASLPYGGYWDDVPVRAGRIEIPAVPGVGYEAKANLHALLRNALETDT
jgi:L-alanine-DL-glutamate epimerase-like enolase superfamily enzyme